MSRRHFRAARCASALAIMVVTTSGLAQVDCPIELDLDGDGGVTVGDMSAAQNLDDLQGLHSCLDIPRGDLDRNGSVDFADFLVMSANFGLIANNYAQADANLDGGVNIEDFAILSSNFGIDAYVPDPPPQPATPLQVGLNAGRVVTFTSTAPVQVGGIEIGSPNGSLVVNNELDASPFSFYLSKTAESVTLGNLGSSVSVDGTLATSVGYGGDTNGEGDLFLRWFEQGSYQVHSTRDGSMIPFVEGEVTEASIRVPRPPAPPVDPVEPPQAVCDGVLIGTSALATAASEAELIRLHQCLDVPRGDVDGDGNAAFADFLMVSGNFGSAGTYSDGDVDLDGQVGIRDFAILSTNFGSSEYLPEPSSLGGLTASLNENNNIVVNADSRVSITVLEFSSENGNLQPVPERASHPFTFMLSNDEHRIVYGALGRGVRLDGQLVTEAKLNAVEEGDFAMKWVYDGSYEVLSFTETPALDPDASETPTFVTIVDRQRPAPSGPSEGIPSDAFVPSVNDDGFIVLSADTTVLTEGVRIRSEAGNLIPIPGQGTGALHDQAEPFQFIVANEPTEIVFGSLGVYAAFDGDWVTPVGVTNDATFGDDLLLDWAAEDGSLLFYEPTEALALTAAVLPADLNHDGQVAFSDFLTLSAHFGQEGTAAEGDIDGNGLVDFGDFLVLSDSFGNQAAQAVPEPSTEAILLLLCACLACGRRGRSE